VVKTGGMTAGRKDGNGRTGVSEVDMQFQLRGAVE